MPELTQQPCTHNNFHLHVYPSQEGMHAGPSAGNKLFRLWFCTTWKQRRSFETNETRVFLYSTFVFGWISRKHRLIAGFPKCRKLQHSCIFEPVGVSYTCNSFCSIFHVCALPGP